MTLALGEIAPDFTLPAVGGGEVALADLADRAAVAVIFSCNHCPYVMAWEDRINQIARDYADRGLAIVAINANDAAAYPADSFAAMAQRAVEKDFVFAYAHDDSQAIAHAYGAERTPEAFLLDGARRLTYHGAVDDSTEPQRVTANHLRDAIEAVLLGEAPVVAQTPPVGCTIKWRR